MNKYIRPMTIGVWLDTSVKILWNNLKSFIWAGLMTYVMYIILNVTQTYYQYFFINPKLNTPSPEIFESPGNYFPVTIILVYTLVLLLFWFVYVFINGVIIQNTNRIVNGQTSSLKDSARVSLKRFGTQILSDLIFAAPAIILLIPVVLIGFLMFFNFSEASSVAKVFIVLLIVFLVFLIVDIPMLILYIFTITRRQSIIIEKLGPWRAIKRSFGLIKGNWWRTLGYGIVIGLLNYAFIIVFSIVGSFLMIALTPFLGVQPSMVIANSISYLPVIITAPFSMIALTIYYFSLRAEKEGYDLPACLSPGKAL